MAELTPEMIAQGIFLDSTGMPTLPDGTPALPENRGGGLLEAIAQQGRGGPLLGELPAGITQDMANAASLADGSMSIGTGYLPPTQTELLFDPYSYGVGPPYGGFAGRVDTNPNPVDPPIWTGDSGGPLGTEPPATMPEGALNWEGGSGPINWQDFHTPKNLTAAGGFWTMEDVFGMDMPGIFQRGSQAPSTNNWRLIPGGRPGMIMRNGQIINTRSGSMYGPQGFDFGMQSDQIAPRWRSGEGMGVPAAYATSPTGWQMTGWPGASAFTYRGATE